MVNYKYINSKVLSFFHTERVHEAQLVSYKKEKPVYRISHHHGGCRPGAENRKQWEQQQQWYKLCSSGKFNRMYGKKNAFQLSVHHYYVYVTHVSRRFEWSISHKEKNSIISIQFPERLLWVPPTLTQPIPVAHHDAQRFIQMLK